MMENKQLEKCHRSLLSSRVLSFGGAKHVIFKIFLFKSGFRGAQVLTRDVQIQEVICTQNAFVQANWNDFCENNQKPVGPTAFFGNSEISIRM